MPQFGSVAACLEVARVPKVELAVLLLAPRVKVTVAAVVVKHLNRVVTLPRAASGERQRRGTETATQLRQTTSLPVK